MVFQILKELDQIPANLGDGFKATKNLDVPGDLVTAAGLNLTASSAPAVLNIETHAIAVQSAASGTALGSFVFVVPEDYDTTRDHLHFKALVQMAGATDTPSLTVTAYKKSPGAALSAALTVVASAPASAAASYLDVKATGNGLKGGDVLTVNLITGAHTTDACNLYGVEVEYRSQIVYGDTTKRFS